MPIHDWTTVAAGLVHDFHLLWTVYLSRSLNTAILPAGFYSMVEAVRPLQNIREQSEIPLEFTSGDSGIAGCVLACEAQAYVARQPQRWKRVIEAG
jgi:hypothetical protein